MESAGACLAVFSGFDKQVKMGDLGMSGNEGDIWFESKNISLIPTHPHIPLLLSL
jgi:hypothetical protein